MAKFITRLLVERTKRVSWDDGYLRSRTYLLIYYDLLPIHWSCRYLSYARYSRMTRRCYLNRHDATCPDLPQVRLGTYINNFASSRNGRINLSHTYIHTYTITLYYAARIFCTWLLRVMYASLNQCIPDNRTQDSLLRGQRTLRAPGTRSRYFVWRHDHRRKNCRPETLSGEKERDLRRVAHTHIHIYILCCIKRIFCTRLLYIMYVFNCFSNHKIHSL